MEDRNRKGEGDSNSENSRPSSTNTLSTFPRSKGDLQHDGNWSLVDDGRANVENSWGPFQIVRSLYGRMVCRDRSHFGAVLA